MVKSSEEAKYIKAEQGERIDPKLFTDDKGNPLVFKISSNEVQDYKYKINQYGGSVIEDDSKLDSNEKDTLIKLSDKPIDSVSYSTDFIDESIRKNELASLHNYAQPTSRKRKATDTGDESDETISNRAAIQAATAAAAEVNALSHTDENLANVLAKAEAVEQLNKNDIGYFGHQESDQWKNGGGNQLRKHQPRKKTSKFNEEKDAFIIEQVRLRPRYRTSHKFYDELAESDILQGHTGHSVRSRCRVHLLPKIDYVYQTDEAGNLILNEQGEKIKVKLLEVPNTLKNRFSAEEDYLLCTEVIKHVLENNDKSKFENRDEQGFFDEKLLSVGISFFNEFANKYPNHSSPSWRDRFRKFARAYGVQKYIRDYQESIKNQQKPEAMKNLTRRKNRKRDAPENLVSQADDDAAEADLDQEEEDEDEEEQVDDVNAAAAAVAAAQAAANQPHHHDGALDEEIGEVKSSNIDEAIKEVDSKAKEAKKKREQENLIKESEEEQDDVDGDVEGEENDIKSSQIGSQDHQSYLKPGYKMGDLFTEAFWKPRSHDEKTNISLEIIKSIDGLFDQDVLNDVFLKHGIKSPLVSHILMSTSANPVRIFKFLKYLYNDLQEEGDFNQTTTDEEKIYQYLFPENRKGIWTPKSDKLIKKGKLKELKDLHGSKKINERKRFLEKNKLL